MPLKEKLLKILQIPKLRHRMKFSRMFLFANVIHFASEGLLRSKEYQTATTPLTVERMVLRSLWLPMDYGRDDGRNEVRNVDPATDERPNADTSVTN